MFTADGDNHTTFGGKGEAGVTSTRMTLYMYASQKMGEFKSFETYSVK